MDGLITDNDETAYREAVRDLTVWCKENNLSLNAIKTKELIVDKRKRTTDHAPILFDGAVVEQVERFKFLGVHITKELSWSKHQDSCEEGTTIPFLKRFGMGPKILKKLNSCTI